MKTTTTVLSLGAVLSVLLLSGCASNSVQMDVRECAEGFMDRQAHVLDATKACSHIYGLKNSRKVRTTDLDDEPTAKSDL